MSAELIEHLQTTYGIDVAKATEIEPNGNVFAIERRDDPAWIARVFPPERPIDVVAGDAEILRALEARDYPAERCAAPDAVTALGDRAVLVTGHVGGKNGRPDHSLATLTAMGDRLGRLHALPDRGGALDRRAGGWHHLSVAGGGRDEDVRILLDRLGDTDLHQRLRDDLTSLDVGAGLPEAILHPDFTTANMMIQPDGDPVVIDWTNAGRGPRVGPLGQLLAAGSWGLEYVDAIVGAYADHVTLTDEEIDRLPDAIFGFSVILAAWYAIFVPPMAAQKVGELAGEREQATGIAKRVREVLR